MSKFKSATTIALSVLLLGTSSPASTQYCNTCSGGTCAMQSGATFTSSNPISTGMPVACESSLYNGTSYGYNTTYSGGYPTSSSIPATYASNIYSSGSNIQTDYGSTAVLNSTYASPNFEPYGSNFIPSTTVSNIPAAPSYSYDSSVVYASPTYSSGMPLNSTNMASTYATPSQPNTTYSNVSPATSYSGTYTSYQPSTSYAGTSGTYANYQPSTQYASTYASPSNSYSAPSSTYTSSYGSGSGMAQQKAHQAANMGLLGHVGGGLDGCKYEGVGWSTVSPDHAISKCCYWGQRPVSQIGVARGRNGMWYACVLYQ